MNKTTKILSLLEKLIYLASLIVLAAAYALESRDALIASITIAVIGLGFWYLHRLYARSLELKQFAASKGFEYKEAAIQVDKANPAKRAIKSSSIYFEDADVTQTDVIAASGIFMQSALMTKGKRTDFYKIGSIKLDKEMPHLILSAKKSRSGILGFRLSPGFAGNYSDKQLVDAGILSQHFKVYTPEDYEIDILSVITPEIVEILIEQTGGFDVEINGNNLHMIATGSLNVKDAELMIKTLPLLAEEINEGLTTYKDDRARASEHNIAKAGRRLRSRSALAGTVFFLCIVLFLVLGRYMDPEVASERAVTVLPLLFGFGFLFTYRK